MAPPFHRAKEKGRLELCEVWGRSLRLHILVTASMAKAERSHSSGAMVIW